MNQLINSFYGDSVMNHALVLYCTLYSLNYSRVNKGIVVASYYSHGHDRTLRSVHMDRWNGSIHR